MRALEDEPDCPVAVDFLPPRAREPTPRADGAEERVPGDLAVALVVVVAPFVDSLTPLPTASSGFHSLQT